MLLSSIINILNIKDLMRNLVIGDSISTLSDTHSIFDLYQGLVYLTENDVKSVVINVSDELLKEMDILAILNLIKSKKVPGLIISDKEEFKVFKRFDYISVISTDASHQYIYNRHIEVLDYKSLLNQLSLISKQKRTIPFYLLGTLLLMEPIIKILYFKYNTGFGFDIVLSTVLSLDDPLKIFEFWFLFPIAGFALFRQSAYSLFVFCGVYFYSMYIYFTYEKFSWPYVQETPHLSANLLLLFNSVLLIYFLMPENLKPFSNKTKLAFRKSQRMSTMFDSILKYDKENFAATIVNISSSGVMISLDKELEENRYMELIIGSSAIKCMFVREINSEKDKTYNYGLKFVFRDRDEKRYLKDYISSLNMKGRGLSA